MKYLTDDLGILSENIKKVAKTGLIVTIKGKAKSEGNPFCIALRADTDALPMEENNPHLNY
jgi:metal-dependent amidase/aminoacylase/carboxypeptidase family protein